MWKLVVPLSDVENPVYETIVEGLTREEAKDLSKYYTDSIVTPMGVVYASNNN